MEGMEQIIKEGEYEEAFRKGASYAIGVGRKFHIRGMDRDDIDNEALYSLWLAITSYDGALKVAFKTYLGNCLSNNLMKLLDHSKRQKRDEESISINDLATILSSYHTFNLDDKIDLHHYLPRIISYRLIPLFKEYLKSGSFRDAGTTLGYTWNETRYLRRCILDTLKNVWLNDGEK
ncbi:MAG: hypothetical protein KAU20_05775 [Nanoarchaeota archaeon]|nr:hypothetical protein [Nanoarchaeota archaeon]